MDLRQLLYRTFQKRDADERRKTQIFFFLSAKSAFFSVQKRFCTVAKRQLTFLVIILSLTLAACTAPVSAPTPAPTETHVPPTASPTQTATATPSPTPTATVTPTPSPLQIAEILGLPIENGPSPYKHSYKIEGDNLMDYLTPIPTVAAQKINGKWNLVTDDQEKYGDLAESLGMPVFEANGRRGDYLITYINAVFTGEYEVADWFYSRQNKTIKDYRGWVVYMDGDGTKQKVLVSMFSPDLPGLMPYRFASFNGGYKGATLEEILQIYQPGQKFKISFVSDGPQMQMVSFRCASEPFDNVCSESRNVATTLRYEQDLNIRVFAASLQDDEPNSSFVPDGLVLPAESIKILDN